MRPLKDKREREETLREWEQVLDRQRQTETDMLSELATVRGSCRKHIIVEKKLEIERATESKTERHTYGEGNRDKAQEGERGRDTERKRQRSIKHTGSKQQGSLPEAARPS